MKYLYYPQNEFEWDINYSLYKHEFECIKEDLPKKLLKVFLQPVLYDSVITSISVNSNANAKNKKERNTVTVEFNDEQLRGSFLHSGVTQFNCLMHEPNEYMGILGDYIQGEILRDGEFWTHNFLTSARMEFFIKCRRIVWKGSSNNLK